MIQYWLQLSISLKQKLYRILRFTDNKLMIYEDILLLQTSGWYWGFIFCLG